MIHSLENEFLSIQVNDEGAQLWSVKSKKTGVEYLWQGDPAYWQGRAYNLFPFIGRMPENIFNYQGATYPTRAHGLARYFVFEKESQTENSITFLFTDNEETRKEYPFAFRFRVTFLLDGANLTTKYEAENPSDKELLCAFGGHPGINIPFGEGVFEDYYLEFTEKKEVQRQLLDETNSFMADKAVPYELVDGVKIPLTHELFVNDAVILENTCGEVALKCDKESRYVSMKYSDFKFIGFWQAPKADTPYVCLEPWGALPAVDGAIVELETKPHMMHVPAGEKAEASFTVTVHE
jgi:galactose mutarotase-like enzyme